MRSSTGALGHVVLLLVVAGVLFVWRLGSHDLWPPDEPRFTLQAREMRASGDYVLPKLNGRGNLEKPPLFFWVINGFALLRGGVDEWAARLPSAVAAAGAMLLIYVLGTWLHDRRTGLWGALVFATSVQVLERARWASIDMIFTLFTLAAIVLLWAAATRPQPRWWWAGLAWVSMGLATLAKGPVGLVLPLLAVGPALLLPRDWDGLRRLAPASGVALYLLVTLGWYLPLASRVGLDEVILAEHRNNVARYLEAANFRHPFWYYLWRFPLGFLPWVFFLPAAIRDAFRDSRDERRSAVFLVTWFAAMFLFFSIASGKRGVYLLPLYPAAALLVGGLFARGVEEASLPSRRRLLIPGALWAAVAAALSALLPLAARQRHPDLIGVAAAAAGIVFAGAVLTAAFLWKGGAGRAAASLVGSMAALSLLATGALVPRINEYQNIRGFAERVKPHLSADVPFATTEEKRDAWVYYIGRIAEEVKGRQEVLDYLAKPGPRDLVIGGPELAELGVELPAGVREVVKDRVGSWDFYLLRKESADLPEGAPGA